VSRFTIGCAGDPSYRRRVLCCLDVDYQPTAVTTACVGFDAWTDEVAAIELVMRSRGAAAAYQPGAFFERELPYLRAALDRMPPLELIVVDAYVWLAPDRPGLGKHLHDAVGLPVVGVAKNHFAGTSAIEVSRGTSARPLYVTAVGVAPEVAADRVRAMHGDHRIPTLIRRVDTLARGRG